MSDPVEAGGEQQPAEQTVTVAEVGQLVKFLVKCVPALLEEEDIVPPALQSALNDKTNQEGLRKFIADTQIRALLVERTSSKDEEGESAAGEEEKEVISYNISTDVRFTNTKINSIVLIKRAAVIEADKSIPSQIRIMNFSDGSPYETLHAYVSNAVAPYFKSYVKESGKAERDGDKMAPSVEKKIAELEMGLLHLQQNIDIPEITLGIHPLVAQVIKKCSDEGLKPKVSDFGDKVEDSTFLNQLQNGVNRWIREIQKVTKLDRDPSSGTALQEISFWLNLERALLRIQEKREALDVALTLDLLKHGKRFHATVSFDTDTGLKQALATVNDYNPLMKDFPINDLLSATELDRIRIALQAIFNHLRKIRNTKYPIQRALRLVEAISRDLMAQLLKVLGTRRLMHIPFEEFEKVMNACFDVFGTWDDEYDKLQGLLRDIVKKKRDEHLKTVWRVSPAHKRLQARMEQMRKFRRQHEQLCSVIVRVLRPTQVQPRPVGSIGQEEVSDAKTEVSALDATDANAIEMCLLFLVWTHTILVGLAGWIYILWLLPSHVFVYELAYSVHNLDFSHSNWTILIKNPSDLKKKANFTLGDLGFNTTDYQLLDPATYELYLPDPDHPGKHIDTPFLSIELHQGAAYTLLLYSDESVVNATLITDVPANTLSMFLQIPQYLVITLAEIMFSVTGLEFSYSQAPSSMKSVLQAAWLLTVAFGNLIVVIVAEAEFFEKQSYEFFLFAGLMTVDMVIFVIMSLFYVYVKSPSELEDENVDASLTDPKALKEKEAGLTNQGYEDDTKF